LVIIGDLEVDVYERKGAARVFVMHIFAPNEIATRRKMPECFPLVDSMLSDV
jgi:hypothetical protein